VHHHKQFLALSGGYEADELYFRVTIFLMREARENGLAYRRTRDKNKEMGWLNSSKGSLSRFSSPSSRQSRHSQVIPSAVARESLAILCRQKSPSTCFKDCNIAQLAKGGELNI
jgi:hypothetical protein